MFFRALWSLIASVTLVTSLPNSSAALQAVPQQTIPRALDCPRCRIVVGPARVLGTDDGPGSLTGSVWGGARDTRGNYYIIAGPNAPPVKFDSAGRFLAELGRMGPGPGEFQGLSSISVIAGDSVYVTDRRSVHVFAPSGAFVRSDAIPVVVRFPVVRKDGSAVVAGSAQTSGGAGWPFHFLARGMGSITKSFGSMEPGAPGSAPAPGRLTMATSRDHGFWTVDLLEYRLTQWDSTGRPRQILVGDPAWWTDPPQPSQRDTAAVPPHTGIRRVYEDPSGLLWVMTLVPGPRWREGWGRKLPDGGYLVSGIRFDLLHDTMIEVIDPRSARLVTSIRLSGYISEYLGPDEILQTTEDASGVPKALVRRIRLDRPPPGGQ